MDATVLPAPEWVFRGTDPLTEIGTEYAQELVIDLPKAALPFDRGPIGWQVKFGSGDGPVPDLVPTTAPGVFDLTNPSFVVLPDPTSVALAGSAGDELLHDAARALVLADDHQVASLGLHEVGGEHWVVERGDRTGLGLKFPHGLRVAPQRGLSRTLHQRRGSCRDLAVLFIEACRLMNIPCRFVSGYTAGCDDDPDRQLHAWAEAYLPGAGWRGFDPSLGLAITENYLALAAAAQPASAAPVSGTFRGPAESRLNAAIEIVC